MVSGVNFLTGILMARLMGIEELGRFTLIWMIVLFFSNLHSALIISPMMSIGPQQTAEKKPAYYGTVVVHQTVYVALSAIILWVGLLVTSGAHSAWHLQGLTPPLIACVIFYQCQEFLRRYLFTCGQNGMAFFNDVISYLGQMTLLLLLFLFAKPDTAMVLWVIAGTSALAFLCGSTVLKGLNFSMSENERVLRRHWISSKWLLSSTIMLWISGNFMIIMAGSLLGVAAAGVLKACQNILGITHILFNALSNIVPIQAGKILSTNGLKSMEHFTRKMIYAGGLATLAIALPALLAPETILKIVYNPKMSSYSPVLRVYALLYLVMFFNQMLTFLLRTIENTKPVFTGYLATAIFSICITYPVNKYYGIQGTVWGMLLLTLVNFSILFSGYRAGRKFYIRSGSTS
jgi:O-antigen/teichoic acid export membrane protein